MTNTMTKTLRNWTIQQQAVIDHVADPDAGPLVVTARAGCGKTTTAVAAVELAKEDRITVCAFSKPIAVELSERVKNPNVDVATLHSIGFKIVLREWRSRGVKVEDRRGLRLALAACGSNAGESIATQVKKLVALGKATLAETVDALVMLAEDHDIGSDVVGGEWTIERLAACALEAMRLARQHDGEVDFDDMVYLPVVNGWVRGCVDLVVVDEAQDMNRCQITMAKRLVRKGGRIIAIGDDRQCQPAGTMIRLPDGEERAIEDMKAGDRVVTYDRHCGCFIQSACLMEVASRNYSGPILTVSAGGRTTRCTDSHKWLVRWTNRTASAWVTYLMRQGTRWRVGQCRLFRAQPTSKQSLSFGLGQRARVERADEAWILRGHETLAEALAYEQVLSVRYGIPEIVFNQPSGVKHFTREVIDRVYAELGDLAMNAERCLKDHGRMREFPIYRSGDLDGRKRGRTTMFETQACNIMSGFMAVLVAPERVTAGYRVGSWEPLTVSSEPWNGTVYSLDVERHHRYIADGILTCNSIYGFRGAHAGILDEIAEEFDAKRLGLTVTFRCGKKIVAEAQAIVPDFSAGENNPDGEVLASSYGAMLADAAAGDFVLSRKNAPLAGACLAFLRRGKRAHIAGRDIGASLAAVIRKVAGRSKPSMADFIGRLGRWADREIERAKARKDGGEARVALVSDQHDTIVALAEGLAGVGELEARIATLFSDTPDAASIRCSSVHKAKGLETDRVWMLDWTFRDSTVEETNLRYVAITRAKTTLVHVVEPKVTAIE